MDITKAGYIRTLFKVHKHCVDTTACVVALIGSHSCLGEWKVEDALMSQHTGLCEWHIDAMLPKSVMLSYKLLLLDSRTRHVLHEEMFTRYLDTDETPMHVELTYGDFMSKKTPITIHMRTGMEEIGQPRLSMDYFLWDPQEKWQLEVKSFHRKVGSALEHCNTKFGRQQSPRQARSVESVTRKRENYRDKVAHAASATKQYIGARLTNFLKPSATAEPVGASTSTSSSWWSRMVGDSLDSTGSKTMDTLNNICAEPVPGINDKPQHEDDKKIFLTEMLPSPFRMMMLGVAVGACVYCKIKK